MKRQAFTLIELLVVIAILGLLAAVLFPVFAHVRENGRRTVCLSNERQIGMAVLQYAGDNDGRWHDWAWEKVSDTGWAHDAAYPYVKSAAVFRCPDDPTRDIIRATPEFPDLKPATADSYAISSDLDESLDAQITAPSKTVMLFEVRNCQECFTEPYYYGTGSMAGDGAHTLNCGPWPVRRETPSTTPGTSAGGASTASLRVRGATRAGRAMSPATAMPCGYGPNRCLAAKASQ